MASTSTTVTSVDCEGPCCCRCSACSTIGYFDQYTATIPKQTQVDSSACDIGLAFVTNERTPKTVTLTGFETSQGSIAPNGISGVIITYPTYSTEAVYGSAGGTGKCVWSYFNVAQHPFIGDWYMEYIRLFRPATFSSGMRLQYDYWAYTPGCGLRKLTSYFDYTSATCIVPGGSNYVHTGDDLVNTVGWTPVWSGNATVDIIGGSTWYQCGQNSDGTTYEESPPPLLISSTMTAASKPTVKKSLDVIPRPDRCDSYNGRDKFRTGCNGWLCAGKCELGIKECMPGGFCQACDKYAVDPDFIGQGPAGWAK